MIHPASFATLIVMLVASSCASPAPTGTESTRHYSPSPAVHSPAAAATDGNATMTPAAEARDTPAAEPWVRLPTAETPIDPAWFRPGAAGPEAQTYVWLETRTNHFTSYPVLSSTPSRVTIFDQTQDRSLVRSEYIEQVDVRTANDVVISGGDDTYTRLRKGARVEITGERRLDGGKRIKRVDGFVPVRHITKVLHVYGRATDHDLTWFGPKVEPRNSKPRNERLVCGHAMIREAPGRGKTLAKLRGRDGYDVASRRRCVRVQMLSEEEEYAKVRFETPQVEVVGYIAKREYEPVKKLPKQKLPKQENALPEGAIALVLTGSRPKRSEQELPKGTCFFDKQDGQPVGVLHRALNVEIHPKADSWFTVQLTGVYQTYWAQAFDDTWRTCP